MELVLSLNLKFYISGAKGLKLKVRKFWELIPTFVEITGEKLLGGGAFAGKENLFVLPSLLNNWNYVWHKHCNSNGTRTQDSARLARWLSVGLRTKWLWVRIPLLLLKLPVWRLLPARSSLTFRQSIECRFSLKLLRSMIITNRWISQIVIPSSLTSQISPFYIFCVIPISKSKNALRMSLQNKKND